MSKIMVFSVHPDDETLGVGGTMLKACAAGDEVCLVNITSGSSHQAGLIDSVVRAYELKAYRNLGFPEVQLDQVPLGDMVAAVADAVQEFCPDTVYVPNRSDVHSDHRKSFEAIIPALKQFRAPFVKRVLMYEVLSETDFAPALPEMAFIPNVFCDITATFTRKQEILSIYQSELLPEPATRSLSAVQALARLRGSRIGVQYAESFMLLWEQI